MEEEKKMPEKLQVEEKVIEMSRRAPDWRNPVWRLADGVVAEW